MNRKGQKDVSSEFVTSVVTGMEFSARNRIAGTSKLLCFDMRTSSGSETPHSSSRHLAVGEFIAINSWEADANHYSANVTRSVFLIEKLDVTVMLLGVSK